MSVYLFSLFVSSVIQQISETPGMGKKNHVTSPINCYGLLALFIQITSCLRKIFYSHCGQKFIHHEDHEETIKPSETHFFVPFLCFVVKFLFGSGFARLGTFIHFRHFSGIRVRFNIRNYQEIREGAGITSR